MLATIEKEEARDESHCGWSSYLLLIIILHSQTESDILLFLTHRPGM
jgi:hypothetical protein